MKKLLLKVAAVGAALAVAGGSALADSRGAGAVTAVSFTLIDLDPNDGIAPSISFAGMTGDYQGPYAYGYVRASTPDEDIYREYTRVGATENSAVNGSTQTAWSSAGSSVAGAAGLGFTGMAVHGEALSGNNISGVYYATAEPNGAFFTLSAHTQVVFTVSGWLTGETTLGGNPDTGFVENGGALLQLETRGFEAGGTVYDRQQADAVAWYTVGANGAVSGESKSWQGSLSSGYSNLGDADAQGVFLAGLSVGGTSVVAVPEPSSYALLLAGLAGIGYIARRRQRA